MENYEDHIVLVDDDNAISLIHNKVLEKAGYKNTNNVESVAKLIQYLEDSLLVGNPVDLILMDVRMPVEDGLSGCAKVQEYEQFRDIPIIMITSVSDPTTLETAFANGAMDYMSKSAPMVEFKSRINSALNLKRERDERKARERELLKLTQSLLAKQTEQQQMYYLDPLTELYNRKGFEKKLEMEWLNAYRQDKTLTLYLVGIDCFEQYNTTYGREEGDACLVKVAQYFSTLDDAYFISRAGGGEFILLLTQSNFDSNEELIESAEDIRHAIMTLNIPHESSTVEPCLTVSIGLSRVNPRNCPGSQLFNQAAEKGLEQAKNQGYNQVRLVEISEN